MRVACIIVASEGNLDTAKKSPPPLPKRLVDLRLPVVAGSVVWFVAWAVLLISGTARDWQWIALAGWVLGIIGMLVMWWQRSASRRGSRGAQRGL
jgi:hypothetical protein